MNLILLFKEDFIEGTDRVRLQGRRLIHVLDVHRASVGDELSVGLLDGLIGSGRVTFLGAEMLEMDVHLDKAPPAPLPLTLILAMPRPKVFRRVIMSVSSMGIKRILVINSYRVEKSFWKSPVLSEESIRRQLILGLEQAKDTVLPEVTLRPRFKPFAEDELPSVIEGTTSILAHPSASGPCPRNAEGRVTLAIGPEGGFIAYETGQFMSCGFKAVHIGERILPVETAVPYLVSRLF